MSSIELAMYMPLLLFVIFLAVQFSLVYLGNQAASAVAREAARVARTSGSAAEAQAAGRRYADNIGGGVLEGATIKVDIQGDNVRVTVTGTAQEISPVGVPTVSQTVEGPLEQFVEGP
ncbi:MAG: TadE/TadG family type IV pilus assembly protein [Nocardioides sp.]|nr:TadE/TadG family type IV pilus assembly protein [Nocardioides sp.]